MDFSAIDKTILAKQLRHPDGADGRKVGEAMVRFNAPAVTFAIECLHIQPTDHVLEIGFGPGEGIAEVVRLATSGFVAGIDQSQTMLEMAQERNHRAIMEEYVELSLGTADQLPFADESFDTVFAVNVFHFWADPTRELADCRRVLKKGGRVLFYVTDPLSWFTGAHDTGIFIPRNAEAIIKILSNADFERVLHKDLVYADEKGFVVFGTK